MSKLETAANELANAVENLLAPCEACDRDNPYVPCTCTEYPYQLQRLGLAVERFRIEQKAHHGDEKEEYVKRPIIIADLTRDDE